MDRNPDSCETPPQNRSLALMLAAAVAFAGAVIPLVPEEYRGWNTALFGALGLFAAARVGFLPGLILMLGSKLAFDGMQWLQKDFNPEYAPYPTVYVCFSLYAVLGWLLLRRSESALRVGGTAIGSSLVFFALSNFISWIKQEQPYGYSLEGLGNCYFAAIPFYRGTFLGDVLFSSLIFGTYALIVRVATMSRTEVVREEVRA